MEVGYGCTRVWVPTDDPDEAVRRADAALRDLGVIPGGPPGLHESFLRMRGFARRGRRQARPGDASDLRTAPPCMTSANRPPGPAGLEKEEVMSVSTTSFALHGIGARPLRVHVEVTRGLPAFTIVGLPDQAVRETRERLRGALVNCGFEFPLERIVVRIAPTGSHRASAQLDLPIAAALLAATGQLDPGAISRMALVGELALDGTVRRVAGVLQMSMAAAVTGLDAIVVPTINGPEAAVEEAIDIHAISSLTRLVAIAAGDAPARPRAALLSADPAPGGPDISDLRGIPEVRRALEVAAAGAHSLLLVGARGSGRSTAASRLPSILPRPTDAEVLEVATIASATGRLPGVARWGRPLRAPHHTIGAEGLLGGGTPPRPGEVTVAHRGVLYLGQVDRFRPDVLGSLWPCMQSGEVSVGRGAERYRFPCRFLLAASADPCPCGLGFESPVCTCGTGDLARHSILLAGLATHFQLCRSVGPPDTAAATDDDPETSGEVAGRVREARLLQEARLGPGRTNSEMTSEEIAGSGLTRRAEARLGETPMVLDRFRVARTLADLEGSRVVSVAHLSGAAGLRVMP
jgi:magnesium chelatase family protein